ncbi:protein of unknown function [Candidatus Methylomirabilis oxygeniifera]|uniref:Uncharacterized protein n=1 Tax=Methylomirabilis oxygeniifera TaxID=671143 RepID=D5MEX0_METO1|nr:protein of unknown function [Candidatus Methylomirabilis oxyfera]
MLGLFHSVMSYTTGPLASTLGSLETENQEQKAIVMDADLGRPPLQVPTPHRTRTTVTMPGGKMEYTLLQAMPGSWAKYRATQARRAVLAAGR